MFGTHGCAKCQLVRQYLEHAGQSVKLGEGVDLVGFKSTLKRANATKANLFLENQTAPLVIRGNQVVIANRQDQAGALRY